MSLVTRPSRSLLSVETFQLCQSFREEAVIAPFFDYLILDVDTRSYNSFHGKMDDKETEDLIRGKEGTSTR